MTDSLYQIVVIIVVVLLIVFASARMMFQIQRERIQIEELRSKISDVNFRHTPEREFLDKKIYELHDQYITTTKQVEELNELVRLSLRAHVSSPTMGEFSKTSDIIDRSSFLQGLGIRSNAIEYRADNVFVLTPFAKSSVTDFRFIQQICSDLGLSAFRASDRVEKSQSLLTSIIYSIASSRFIIANLNGRNPNVFYEMGIAQMLDKKVIMIAHVNQKIAFNASSQEIVMYNNRSDLKDSLTAAISKSALLYKPQ